MKPSTINAIRCRQFTLFVPVAGNQGVGAIQHQANANTEITVIPGAMAMIQKKNVLDGSLEIQEFAFNGNIGWAYKPMVENEVNKNPS